MARHGLYLPDDVAAVISSSLCQSLMENESLVARIVTLSDSSGSRPISLPVKTPLILGGGHLVDLKVSSAEIHLSSSQLAESISSNASSRYVNTNSSGELHGNSSNGVSSNKLVSRQLTGTSLVVYFPESLVHLQLSVTAPGDVDQSGVFSLKNQSSSLSITETLSSSSVVCIRSIGRLVDNDSLSAFLGSCWTIQAMISPLMTGATQGTSVASSSTFFPGIFDTQHAVKRHYDEKTVNQVSQERSRSGGIRKANNAIKSWIYGTFLRQSKGSAAGGTSSDSAQASASRNISVLDLACGHGQDLLKFKAAGIRSYIGVDISEAAIAEASGRYKSMVAEHELGVGRSQFRRTQINDRQDGRASAQLFGAQFICADITKSETVNEVVSAHNRDKVGQSAVAESHGESLSERSRMFDAVTMQFAIHYLSSNRSAIEALVDNLWQLLAPGGMFIFTTVSSRVLARRFKEARRGNPGDTSFGNTLYTISLNSSEIDRIVAADVSPKPANSSPSSSHANTPWGCKYTFWLADTIDSEPEFVVPIDAVSDILSAKGFKHVFTSGFRGIIDEIRKIRPVPPLYSSVLNLSDSELDVVDLYLASVWCRV